MPQSHVLDVAEAPTSRRHGARGESLAQYLNAALDQFDVDAQVLIAQHTWPVWGNERVRAHLANQRDLYKYLHDPPIRMMNQGLGRTEIAEDLTMPPGLETDWSARGYYRTIPHDSKAVYQRYLGWYDGNPANLNRFVGDTRQRFLVSSFSSRLAQLDQESLVPCTQNITQMRSGGVGPGRVNEVYRMYLSPTDPVPACHGHLHNNLVQVAAEFGLPVMGLLSCSSQTFFMT